MKLEFTGDAIVDDESHPNGHRSTPIKALAPDDAKGRGADSHINVGTGGDTTVGAGVSVRPGERHGPVVGGNISVRADEESEPNVAADVSVRPGGGAGKAPSPTAQPLVETITLRRTLPHTPVQTPLPKEGEQMISRYWPAFAVKDAVVASTVTIVVILLAMYLIPRQIVTDPIYRTAVPSPDWMYLYYFLPYMYLQGAWQLPALLTIPPLAMLLLILVPFVQRGRLLLGRTRTGKMLTLAVVTLVVGGIIATTAHTGSRVPIQGCETCHRSRMVGAPPTEVKGFGKRESQWIARHILDPQYWWMR